MDQFDLLIDSPFDIVPSLSIQASLNWGNKKDEPVFVTEESGVVGLNFHQSKEMLINESNGHLDVSIAL